MTPIKSDNFAEFGMKERIWLERQGRAEANGGGREEPFQDTANMNKDRRLQSRTVPCCPITRATGAEQQPAEAVSGGGFEVVCPPYH